MSNYVFSEKRKKKKHKKKEKKKHPYKRGGRERARKGSGKK
jgi:hypothetical protein